MSMHHILALPQLQLPFPLIISLKSCYLQLGANDSYLCKINKSPVMAEHYFKIDCKLIYEGNPHSNMLHNIMFCQMHFNHRLIPCFLPINGVTHLVLFEVAT